MYLGILDSSIEAPPSILPQKRYCDITGLEVRRHQWFAVLWGALVMHGVDGYMRCTTCLYLL